MRITGGTHRGRQLITPPDDHIRPTADKTRLAIFNMLEARGIVRDAVAIDVFCGTGALGLESISRGSTFCTFIDQSPVAVTLARRNAAALRCETQAQVIQTNATTLPVRPETTPPATLVFMDPPYHQNLVIPTLAALAAGNWVDPRDTTYIIETEKEWVPNWPDHLTVIQTKTYGITAVYILTGKNND